jgi:predicted transposase/invertase (TIGR01784 family)
MSALKDKYINPLTDFGFKKLLELPKFKKQEDELETQFDKWLYVFRHLSNLQGRPKKLQDRIFQKLFEAAEIAKFSPEERDAYEESLKYYRDLKNVVDTSRTEGIKAVAKKMKDDGEPIEKIVKYTNLSREEIDDL